jgi:hypothetical protein
MEKINETFVFLTTSVINSDSNTTEVYVESEVAPNFLSSTTTTMSTVTINRYEILKMSRNRRIWAKRN